MPTAPMLPDNAMPLAEVARRYRVHVSTVHRWIDRGVRGRKLVAHRVGGKRYVVPEELDEFIVVEGNPTDVAPEDDRPAIPRPKRASHELETALGRG
jgi:excisionase family DNA binding protein